MSLEYDPRLCALTVRLAYSPYLRALSMSLALPRLLALPRRLAFPFIRRLGLPCLCAVSYPGILPCLGAMPCNALSMRPAHAPSLCALPMRLAYAPSQCA
jgi:hypothetical protein